jgi:uncharacterized protein (DUF2235 family)
MSKTIIFCADGTWNGPEKEAKVSPLEEVASEGELSAGAVTNVFKFFANLAGDVTPETLALADEQEKVSVDGTGKPVQIAKYLHGVGDSRNPIMKLLGGTLGVGVINRIVRGYTFISRVWVPGDTIHIVGFSRGAYTARALAGSIAQVGLLDPATYDAKEKEGAYRLGMAAWLKAKSAKISAGKLSGAANLLLGTLERVGAARLPENALIPNVAVKSVAVWDTVGSLGIPEYTDEGRLDILRFTDEILSAKIERGFHAMAVDELRVDFPLTKWNARDGVEQVWFVGSHSDVGGGYDAADCYLSDIGLSWMMRKLGALGVQYTSPLSYVPKPQVLGGPFHMPWLKPPFNLTKHVARHVDVTDLLHGSVRDRWKATANPLYRPSSMVAFENSIKNAQFDDALLP